MKIQAPQIKQVQSMGRANLSGVASVAAAVSSLGAAERQLADHAAGVAKEFIRREEKASFANSMTEVKTDTAKWVEENAVKKEFSAEELKGKVKGIKLTTTNSDQYGDLVEMPRKNIPAHEVYPQLLEAKLKGAMEASAANIINPLDRQAFIETRTTYNADTVLSATLKAADQQYTYQRNESDIKRKDALMRGDFAIADFEVENFEGTELEKRQRYEQNEQGKEIWQADSLIQMEDVDGMQNLLNYLKDPYYAKKGGPLPERKNIEVQNRLKSKIGSMVIRRGASDKQFTSEMRFKGKDMLAALNNGRMQPAEQVAKMQQALDSVGLTTLSIKLRRAEKTAPVIDAFYKTPAAEHETITNSFFNEGITTGNEAIALRNFLLEQSKKVEKEINRDANGVYQRRNFSQQLILGDKGYFSETVKRGKQASNAFKVPSQPLTAPAANQLAENFKSASVNTMTGFIEQVLSEVPEKADQDAIFTQIDRVKNGNLNVYADMVERGDKQTIKEIERGNRLRLDPAMKKALIPSDLAVNILPEIKQVFPLSIQAKEYREAVMDYYAADAEKNGVFDETFYNSDRMERAIKAVIGNVVDYNGRKFLLPNNELDAGDFENWVDNIPLSYIKQLGGVSGMGSEDVMKGLRSGDIILQPSTKRGQYLLYDVMGRVMQTENTDEGKPSNFTLIYDRTQVRDTLSFDAFKAKAVK